MRALKTALSFKASYDASGTWTFGVNLDPDAPGGGADSGVLETDLEKLLKDLSAAAAEEGVGLAVLVDEAQDLTPEEMVALCSTAHKASQQSWPALFCLAGLPSLPKDLATAKSYAERLFDYHHVTSLSDVAAAEAIIEPAKAMGVAWEEAAVDLLIRKTRGYPYFIQQYGQETWNEARGDHTITLIDAQYGVEHGQRQLDYGFFRARWDRATPGEQQYLRAMCIDGDAGSNSRDIAKRMDRKHSALGPTRSRLISKGLIYAPEYGRVEFTVPGMAAFVSRQNNE